MLARRHDIVGEDRAPVERFHKNKQRHDLCDRRGRSFCFSWEFFSAWILPVSFSIRIADGAPIRAAPGRPGPKANRRLRRSYLRVCVLSA